MRIVLIGASGQLGTALQNRLEGEVIALDHSAVEITDPDSVRQLFEQHQPGCLINTAAYNKVDQAESEPEEAYRINALGPRLLAQESSARNVKLIHISTDYVFGGDLPRLIPYSETDYPYPRSVYGTTKLAGEYFVRSVCPRHFVIRTCGLYGQATSPGKGNFVKTMLQLAQDREELRVVSDQHCTPTSAIDLAEAIARLLPTETWGLYHVTNSGSTTWADFAREIFRHAELPVKVKSIPSSEYPTPATRPGYSILDCRKLTVTTGWKLPHWQDALQRYLQKIL